MKNLLKNFQRLGVFRRPHRVMNGVGVGQRDQPIRFFSTRLIVPVLRESPRRRLSSNPLFESIALKIYLEFCPSSDLEFTGRNLVFLETVIIFVKLIVVSDLLNIGVCRLAQYWKA